MDSKTRSNHASVGAFLVCRSISTWLTVPYSCAIARGAPVVDAPAPAIPSSLCEELALSEEDSKLYERLWSEADVADGFLAAKAAVKFLGTSGLAQVLLSRARLSCAFLCLVAYTLLSPLALVMRAWRSCCYSLIILFFPSYSLTTPSRAGYTW